MTESSAALLRLVAVLAVIAAVWFFGDRVAKAIQAPVQTQLDAARSNNAAMKAGSDVQNANVAGMKKASDERVAKSKAAVEKAGAEHYKRAEQLQAVKPAGDTPLARAANFLNETYGPK